jgi:photosystem II stability/assembly factor-like uncharacterized protein
LCSNTHFAWLLNCFTLPLQPFTALNTLRADAPLLLRHSFTKRMSVYMRIFILMLLLQVCASCRPDKTPPATAAGSLLPTASARKPDAEKNKAVAASIVFQSSDGGGTWQDIGAGLPGDFLTNCIYAANGEVLLGTEAGLYRRSGAAEASKWEKDLLAPAFISAIFPGQNGLYLSSFRSGLYQRVGASDLWVAVYTDFKNKGLRCIFEGTDGAVFIGCDSGIFKSSDDGKTWKQVWTGGMVLDIVAAGDVLVGGGEKGVLRSVDGGEHWTSALYENIMSKKTGVLKDRFVTIFGTEDPTRPDPKGITRRLRISADGGKTWQRPEQPLLPIQGAYQMDVRLSQMLDVYEVVQAGEHLFCSFDAGVFRSSDQGKTWEPVLLSQGKGKFNITVSGKVVYAALGSVGC